MDINEVAENEVVDEEVMDGSDIYEVSDERDWKKDLAAIGIGALAVDGAVHVGKFVYTKGVKPLCGKIKSGFQKMKEAKAEKKAAEKSAESETTVTK